MRYVDDSDRASDRVTVAPGSCPACKSTDLATTSKTIDEATYWRCRTCGEVWNASRRKETERSSFRR